MKYSSKYGFLLPEDHEYYSIDHNNTNFGDESIGIDKLLDDTKKYIKNTFDGKQYEQDFRELECILTLGSDWRKNKKLFINDSEWTANPPKHNDQDDNFKATKDMLDNVVNFDHVSTSSKNTVTAILNKPIIDLTLTDISKYIDILEEEYKERFNGEDDLTSFVDGDLSIKQELIANEIVSETHTTYQDFIYGNKDTTNTYEWYENNIRNMDNFKPLLEIGEIEKALNILLDGKDINERLDYLASDNIKYLYRYIDKFRLEKMLSRNYEGKVKTSWFRDKNTGLMINFGDKTPPLKELLKINKDDKGKITSIDYAPISLISELSYIDSLADKISDTSRIFDDIVERNLQGVYDSSDKFSTKTNMLYSYIQKNMNIVRKDNSFEYDITVNIDKMIFNDIYRNNNSIDDMSYQYTTTSTGESTFTMNLYKQTKINNINDDISYLQLVNYSDNSCDGLFTVADATVDKSKEIITINSELCECTGDIIGIIHSNLLNSNDTFDFVIEGCKLENFMGSIYLKHNDDETKNVVLIDSKSVDYLDGIINKNITLLDNASNYASIMFDGCSNAEKQLSFSNMGIYMNIFSGASGNLYTISKFDTADLPIKYDYSIWSKYIQKTNKYYISSINVIVNDNTFYNMAITYKIPEDESSLSVSDMISRELPLYESNFAMYYKDPEYSKKYGLDKEGYDHSITSNNSEIIQNGRILGDTSAAATYINSANIYKSVFYKLYGIFGSTVTKRIQRVIDNSKYYWDVSEYKELDLEERNIDYNLYTLEIISNAFKSYKNPDDFYEFKYHGKLPNGTTGWAYVREYTSAYSGWDSNNYWTIRVEQIMFTEYGKIYYRYGTTLEFAATKDNLMNKTKTSYKKVPVLGDSSKDFANIDGSTLSSRLSQSGLPDDLKSILRNRQIAWGYNTENSSSSLRLNNYLDSNYDYKTAEVRNWFIEVDNCMTLSEIFDYMPHRRDIKYEYNGKYYTNQINLSHTNKFCDVESGWE